MISSQPLSPIHGLLEAMHPLWSSETSEAKRVIRIDQRDEERAAILGLADLSHQNRAGAKGRGTAEWLSKLGVTIPSQANSWCPLPSGGLVARLGNTEFLVENDATLVEKIMQTQRAPGVYPVLHQDAAFGLCGARVNELLLQTCNIDFRMLDAQPSKVVLTSIAGVGITILSKTNGKYPSYRIWCDGTYGIYLWETLAEIATELGGGCIGVDAVQ
ncbi:MAG: methylglutamate dehydrogenase [Gallionella sp.]|nr:methylglutamate dehydrogenase [Gallionella sp.]